jgi:hypothetical protein
MIRVRIPTGQYLFCNPKNSRPVFGAHPASVNAYWIFLPQVAKRFTHKIDRWHLVLNLGMSGVLLLTPTPLHGVENVQSWVSSQTMYRPYESVLKQSTSHSPHQMYLVYWHFNGSYTSSNLKKRYSNPITGLEWPRGFHKVKVPRLHDNGTGWW